jgi:hypothetical protein
MGRWSFTLTVLLAGLLLSLVLTAVVPGGLFILLPFVFLPFVLTGRDKRRRDHDDSPWS